MTPLETALIALLASIASGLVVKFIVGTGKVSCADCDKRHEDLDARAKKDKGDHEMILRMVRSIVVHLGVDPDKKESILNDVGGPK